MLPTREEFRSSLRALRRSPGFVAVAVFSLGLAIALNTTMFAVVDALLYPQYPFADQSQLYRVAYVIPYTIGRNCTAAGCSASGRAIIADAYHHALQVIEREPFFDTAAQEGFVGFLSSRQFDIAGASTLINGAVSVTPNYFTVLGMKAYRGRLFHPAELDAADHRYAVISYRLWRRLFSDRVAFEPFAANLGDSPYEIIGVLPARAELALGNDVYIAGRPGGQFFRTIIRAKPGVPRLRVEAALTRLNGQLAREWGTNPVDSRYMLDQLTKVAKQVQGIHVALMAAVVAVLLIACANLSNLQLARGLGRARELAVRSAIGASRFDVLRLLLVESAILGAIGTGLGVMLSLWGIAGLRGLIPPSVQGLGFIDPQLSWRVFVFAAAAMLVTIFAFGLIPAIRASRPNIDEVLKSGAGTAVTRGGRRQYSLLVIGEIAGALVLFAGATLLFSAARKLHTFDMGYDPKPLISASAYFTGREAGAAGPRQQARAMLDAVRSRPEVVAATLTSGGGFDSNTVSVDDPTRPRVQYRLPQEEGYQVVTADFFRTFGISILHGSDFSMNDDGRLPSVIVDSAAAARWWPGVDPVGRMIKLGPLDSDRPWIRVIGVSRTARFYATEDEPYPQVFLLTQLVDRGNTGMNRAMRTFGATLVARVRTDPRQFLVTIRQNYGGFMRLRVAVLWDEAAGLHALRQSHDFIAVVFVVFALFGLALAMIGIYGVVAHSVAQRTREFGVRFALGADSRTVMTMVMREGNLVTLLGLAAGLLLTYWGVGLIQYFLFGVDPAVEAAVLAVAPLAMYAAATAATWAPALRASRVNPVEALRNE